VYGHTNGPRFETRAEIRWLGAAGVTAVSQTCGPEAVLAGELELPYALVGFPVNQATGVARPESREELDRLLALAADVLPRIVLRAAETLEEEDLIFEHGYVYRVEGGIDGRKSVPGEAAGGA
jgi:purine nucleoside phosphorylase